MGYTALQREVGKRQYIRNSYEDAAVKFIRECCEGLRFDAEITAKEDPAKKVFFGSSIKPNQVPYNMQMDVDRLCLERAVERFMKSGNKEDAFDVYFCYLEMFVGDYEKTRRMIELLSEYESVGSGLLMKHRDHYSHSVYVFILGLAIFQSNSIYRKAYQDYYQIPDLHQASAHFLKYWGLSSLFHDIGYPFELPFEQVCSYFEVKGDERTERPYVAYRALDNFVELTEDSKSQLKKLYPNKEFNTTNEVFAYILAEKLSGTYSFTEEEMLGYLIDKPTHPEKFNHFMDHAYFSATVLYKKLFQEMGLEMNAGYLDAITAILMHNSLYKFCIAHYKSEGNKPFKPQLHPLAYMLMICDELQCWDRTAYGRNSKKELHPMGCDFDFSDDEIKAVYLFDQKEMAKVNNYKDEYIKWLTNPQGKAPKMKAYSGMFLKDKDGVCDFLKDIESIVDLTEIKLSVDTGLAKKNIIKKKSYLSDSNFINLYQFALILNGRWAKQEEWKKAREAGHEDEFLLDKNITKLFAGEFKTLSLEYKLYNINQAKSFAKYMNEIGCFYTDKEVDFELLEEFTLEDMQKIGPMEHHRWVTEHCEMGWVYGEPASKDEREFQRAHMDMIPNLDPKVVDVSEQLTMKNYIRIGKEEQEKDIEPMECMLAMLKVFDGLRIYRMY